MTFVDWLFSNYPASNQKIHGQWGLFHILVLVGCIITIVALALIFKNKNEKVKRRILFVLIGLILFFEIVRRVINICKGNINTTHDVLHMLLPRPWCAISCWVLIISAFVNKKFFYNFASFSSLLCAIIFFIYPGVGFNDTFILFENVYSIVTHSLLLITSITLITLKFTEFKYKTIWKELLCLLVVIIYAFLEIYVLKIENDPLYFMPNGDIQDILSVTYPIYLAIYITFMTIYINLFYLIGDRKTVFKRKNKKQK